jgi:DNA-directed RNA polymerase subunit RPC12/RpoP
VRGSALGQCRNCQEQLSYAQEDGWKYCPDCGTQLNKPRAKPPQRGERYLYEPKRVFVEGGSKKKECRECGTTVDGEREYCPKCGSRFILKAEPFVQSRIPSVQYLGGCSAFGYPREGSLIFAQDGIAFGTGKVAAAEVKAVEIGGGQIAKSRVLPAVMFGVWGLGAKTAKDRTEVAVHLHTGTAAFFVVDKVSPFQIRARITSALRAANIPFAEDLSEGDTSPDESDRDETLVSQLERLAELHDRGFLSDDEVAAAKAKLLG